MRNIHTSLVVKKMIKSLALFLFFFALLINVNAQTLTPSSMSYCAGTNGVTFTITGATGSYDLYKDAVYQETAVDMGGIVTFLGNYSAGSYTTVPATNTVVITMTTIIANAGNNTTTCPGSCVMLNASGGNTYMWMPGGLAGATVNVCPTTTTTYTLTVSANGCTATDNITITVTLLPVTVSITEGNASCGLCNGSAIANVSGGTPPYLYMLSGIQQGQVMTGLCPGQYNLVVTDFNGCSASPFDSLTIYNTNSLSVVLDTLINANCENNSLGSISVHADCGAGGYSYQWYQLIPGAIDLMLDAAATIIDLTEGDYYVVVIDANNDSSTAYYTVSNTSNIYASMHTTNANCGNNGSATVFVQGAHPPFTYLWSDPFHQTTSTATGLTQGIYWVTITDTIGCTLIANANILSGCLNIIKGRIFLDTNQNCIQDTGEIGIPFKVVYATPGYYYGSTNASGDFTITTPNMNNILYAPSNVQPFSLTCPVFGTYTIDFTNVGDTSTGNDFGLFSNPNFFDLGIHPGWTGVNPGFNKKYWILYYNNSPLPQNVLIRFSYDSLLQYTSCTQGGVHYPAQHKIEWTINNIPPSGYGWSLSLAPYIYFYVPTSVSINTILHSCFEILPITGDANPSDNTLCSEEAVTGSHDPNSKSVSPVGETTEGYISKNDSSLLYTIHFQNDGNDTAFTVIVVDTLSPYLDPATIIPGAASHPYTFDLSGQGIITFRFDNILLPDSNVNEPASNGYINYLVKQKIDNPEGTVITNTAANYFDFNPPVSTNTVKNTINSFFFISENLKNTVNIKLFPNPAHDAVNIEILNAVNYPCRLKIYNEMSAIVSQSEIVKSFSTIYCNSLKMGFYFYIIEDNKGAVIGRGKMIKQ